MRYYLFIDESGSLNGHDLDRSIFSVSISLIESANNKKLKNWFKRETLKLKKKLKVNPKDELKAHTFIEKDKKDLLIDFAKRIRSKFVADYASFIENRNINIKWLNNKNVTYNFMVKCAIERMVLNHFFNPEDELAIIADNREVSTGSLNSLKEYLHASFVLEQNTFDAVTIDFVESQLNWQAQLADFISYLNYDEIRNGEVSNRKRRIY